MFVDTFLNYSKQILCILRDGFSLLLYCRCPQKVEDSRQFGIRSLSGDVDENCYLRVNLIWIIYKSFN